MSFSEPTTMVQDDSGQEQLYAWVSDMSAPASAMPVQAVERMLTAGAGAGTKAKDTEMEWLRTRSTEVRLPDAAESARILALLTPAIDGLRAMLAAWHAFELDSARVIRDGGLLADKMTMFRAEVERRRLAPEARTQLAQLEWARFLVVVHQQPLTRAGLDLDTMHHANDYVERVTDEQLDAVLAALPADEVRHFCAVQSTPVALRRVLASMLRQPSSTNETLAPGPEVKVETLADLVAWFGTERADAAATHAHLATMRRQMLANRDLRALLSLTTTTNPDDPEQLMAQRLDVMNEFLERQLLPALSQKVHALADAQTDAARLAVAFMPADELAE